MRTHDFLFQIESRVKSALQSSIDGFYAGDTGTDAVSLGFNFLFITVSPPAGTVQSVRVLPCSAHFYTDTSSVFVLILITLASARFGSLY